MTDKKKWKYYKDFCETVRLDFFEDDVSFKSSSLSDLQPLVVDAMMGQCQVVFDEQTQKEIRKIVEKHKLEDVQYEFYYDIYYETRRCGIRIYGKKPLSEAEKRREIAKGKKKKEREYKEYERLRKKFEGTVSK